jgi:hypothetical protein
VDDVSNAEIGYRSYGESLGCMKFGIKKHIRRVVLRHAHLSSPNLVTFLILFDSLEEVIFLDCEGSLDSGAIQLDNLEASETIFAWQRSTTIEKWAQNEFDRFLRLYGDVSRAPKCVDRRILGTVGIGCPEQSNPIWRKLLPPHVWVAKLKQFATLR